MQKTKTISRSVFISQILQNAKINIFVHWKFWRKYGSVSHLFSCTSWSFIVMPFSIGNYNCFSKQGKWGFKGALCLLTFYCCNRGLKAHPVFVDQRYQQLSLTDVLFSICQPINGKKGRYPSLDAWGRKLQANASYFLCDQSMY